MADEQSTQLADTKPKLETALRVAIPINVPQRNAKPSRDQYTYTSTFSPFAVALTRQKDNLDHVEKKKDPTNIGKNIINMDHDAQVKTALKDFSVLAFSSKRAGKKDVEALAYASLGVMYDNQEEYVSAIENYKLYLQLSQELNDSIGAAAACNCIGVDYMEMAAPHAENLISDTTTVLSDVAVRHLNHAIEYHQRHLEIGPDAGGKFVANINLGLCLAQLGEVNQAARHFQDGLRVAIKMQTLYGQSIAVGNLGLLALSKRDCSTARTCFDQHLQLIQALMDPEAEILAWKLLADLSTAEENFADAAHKLEQARKIAEKEGLLNELRRIHCLIGVSKGTVEFRNFANSLLEPETY
eukprot:gene33112-40054_t